MAEKQEKQEKHEKASKQQAGAPAEAQAGAEGAAAAGQAEGAPAGAPGAGPRVPGAVKKARKKVAAEGIVHIRSTFNNTLVNITDLKGNVICWNSPGKSGFKGSRKSTPFAAQIAAEVAGKMAFDAGVRKVEVHIQGAGNGRESAIRAIASTGIKISAIKDYTSIPHNGCRPPKRRRV